MHVAILSPYSFAHPGGVQEYCRGLARTLKGLGHDVTLFAPDMGRGAANLDGILTVSLGRALRIPANGSVAPVGIDPRMLVRLDLALDPADVLHVNEPFQPASLAAAWRAPRGVPVVGTFHMAADRFPYYALARPLLPRWARRLAATTASSEISRDTVRRYVDVRPRVVPNGLDVARYACARPDPWMRALGRTVLLLGRPEPRKGFDVALDAFASVAASRPDLHLVCTAPPETVRRERVHCLGRVPDERKAALFAAADVFCAPNLGRESFGIVVAEAMAAGAAVLASDIPGFRAAGGDAVEYLAAGDRLSWTHALAGLLEDPERRRGLAARGREHVRRFDWRVVASEILEVYEQAVSGRKA